MVRVINIVQKSSTMDHIYCKDPTLIESLTRISPIFGDHVIVLFNKFYENSAWYFELSGLMVQMQVE